MQHLRNVNETYFEHMKVAWGTAWNLFIASIVLVAHGLCPWWFTAYGSDSIRAQYKAMNARNRRAGDACVDPWNKDS